ncbi:MAG: hypothetical protein IJU82_02105 [Ruminiclostridium sp.]|nr:hypothetical protein [Ruminiclostridium sp.]
MKISPLKDYKAPKYAAKIAALLAVTAAVSGCKGPVLGGAAPMPEHTTTTPAPAAGQSAPAAVTLSETEKPTPEGTVVTTTEEEIECTQLDGDVAVSADTTAVIGAGSIISALGAIKDRLFGSKQPELIGDVPNIEDPENELELMGKVAMTTDPEPELMGDVPELTDTTEKPDTEPELEGEPAVATDDPPELMGDVPAYSERLDNMIDYSEKAIPLFEKAFGKDLYSVTSKDEMYYRTYEIDDILFEMRTYLNFGNGKNNVIYIAFFVRGSELDNALQNDKRSIAVGEGYMLDFDEAGKNMLLLIPYDYYLEPLEQSVCDGIAAGLKDKGYLK